MTPEQLNIEAIIARTPTPKSIYALVVAAEKVLAEHVRDPFYAESFAIACDDLQSAIDAMLQTIGASTDGGPGCSGVTRKDTVQVTVK